MMEVAPVDIDAWLAEQVPPPFSAMNVKRCTMPDLPSGTYRLDFEDGTSEQLQADHASHAFQLCERSDIVRIVPMATALEAVMIDNEMTQDGACEWSCEMKTEDVAEFVVAIDEHKKLGTFEMLDFNDFAQLHKE